MKFVLDASTAIRVVVPEALGGAYAEDVMRLLERRGKPECPQTWRADVASGLHPAYLAKKISEAAARAALRRLQALPGKSQRYPYTFLDVGVTKSQRYPYSHGEPLKGLEGRA